MEPEEIVVAFWYGDYEKELGIKRNAQYPYSKRKLNQIINHILSKNLQVMIYQYEKMLLLWVDNGKFRQR